MKAFNPEKELRKIQYGNRYKIITFVIILLIVSVISYSFALYQVRYSKRIIYTKVAPFSNNKDLNLAVYVNGVKQNDLPDKNSGYKYSAFLCENGNVISQWNEEKWELEFLSTVPIPNKCTAYFFDMESGDVKNFEYTGTIKEYVVPKDGLYKLEVWGAQGGNSTRSIGGYGGYSVGVITLSKDTPLYIVVGGKGIQSIAYNASYDGGYNGGGAMRSVGNVLWGSGGGATHIATTTGLLSELKENKDSVLIVAGGGGGAGSCNSGDCNGHTYAGGHAGGYIGVNGTGPSPGYGGTQESGGRGASGSAEFGIGASGTGSGGGGGYYGGGLGYTFASSAGGGSSYISSVLLNASMYCYNCTASDDTSIKTVSVESVSEKPTTNSAKIGDGYARITYLGE